jgi:hypothetical protein
MVYEPCLLCRAREYRRRVEEIRRMARQDVNARSGSRSVA